MQVTLLSYTPEPDKLVAIAAKQCYSAKIASEIKKSLTDEEVAKFVQKLFDLGHESPFEHVSFTFGISGVSRNLSHQLVRHRIASYSQKSQRYVNEGDMIKKCIIPPSIDKNEELKETFVSLLQNLQNAYDIFVKAGVKKEDARYILPSACSTDIVVTMNARSLFNFFNHRCCTRAQWEIRLMANLMLKEVKKVAPNIFAKAGATCENLGYCPEGNMSCGRFPTLDKIKNN